MTLQLYMYFDAMMYPIIYIFSELYGGVGREKSFTTEDFETKYDKRQISNAILSFQI